MQPDLFRVFEQVAALAGSDDGRKQIGWSLDDLTTVPDGSQGPLRQIFGDPGLNERNIEKPHGGKAGMKTHVRNCPRSNEMPIDWNASQASAAQKMLGGSCWIGMSAAIDVAWGTPP